MPLEHDPFFFSGGSIMETLNFKELAHYIELSKQKAELDFKYAYLKETGVVNRIIEDQRTRTHETLKTLESKFARFGLSFIFLAHEDIQELNSSLSSYSVQEIAGALSTKTGPIYELLFKKSILMKRNLENRYELGKLILFAHSLDSSVKSALVQTIKKGSVSEDLSLDAVPESIRYDLVKILSRIGILPKLPDESCVLLDNYPHWVPVEHAVRLDELFKRIKTITARLQILQSNPSLDPQEIEKLQVEYLSLLKEQDSLLAPLKEEEKRAAISI